MKILDQQRQGEALFIMVDDFTDNDKDYESVKPEGSNLIIAHSETGHHHVIDISKSKQADFLINKTNQFMARLVLGDDCYVDHLRGFDTHETLKLPKGKYVVRYAREYSPEGLRKVMD